MKKLYFHNGQLFDNYGNKIEHGEVLMKVIDGDSAYIRVELNAINGIPPKSGKHKLQVTLHHILPFDDKPYFAEINLVSPDGDFVNHIEIKEKTAVDRQESITGHIESLKKIIDFKLYINGELNDH